MRMAAACCSTWFAVCHCWLPVWLPEIDEIGPVRQWRKLEVCMPEPPRAASAMQDRGRVLRTSAGWMPSAEKLVEDPGGSG